MSLPINIIDSNNQAKVSQYGQLVTAPLDFSAPKFQALAVINTAYNFFQPLAGHRIVITDIAISSNKDVTVNGSLVEIYTSDVSSTSTTVKENILTCQIAKNDSEILSNLNWLCEPGRWIQAKTDTATIYITIAGYYIPLIERS